MKNRCLAVFVFVGTVGTSVEALEEEKTSGGSFFDDRRSLVILQTSGSEVGKSYKTSDRSALAIARRAELISKNDPVPEHHLKRPPREGFFCIKTYLRRGENLMQQYDYMLGELKKLRNKITNKELNKKLSFMEIVWTRRLYQELGDEAGKLDNTLKKRGSNTKESIMYCLSTIFSGGGALLVCDCPIF